MFLDDSWFFSRPKEQDVPFDRQYAYLPKSMDPSLRRRIENRLNPDLCKSCNR